MYIYHVNRKKLTIAILFNGIFYYSKEIVLSSYWIFSKEQFKKRSTISAKPWLVSLAWFVRHTKLLVKSLRLPIQAVLALLCSIVAVLINVFRKTHGMILYIFISDQERLFWHHLKPSPKCSANPITMTPICTRLKGFSPKPWKDTFWLIINAKKW